LQPKDCHWKEDQKTLFKKEKIQLQEAQLEALHELKQKHRKQLGIPECSLGTQRTRISRHDFKKQLEEAECLEIFDHCSFAVFVGGGS
jgi:hypothetical protein